MDRGSAVIFGADSGLHLSYVRILGPKRNLDHRSFFSLGRNVTEFVQIISSFERSYCYWIVIKYVAFFTIWTKLTVAFTCTNLLLNLYTSVSGCVCGFGCEQKFWRIDGFGAKKARIGGFAYLYSPPSLKCNKLAINVRKTNYVIFRPSQRKVN